MLFLNLFVVSITLKSKSKWGFLCLAHVNQLCTLINIQCFQIEPFEYIQSLCVGGGGGGGYMKFAHIKCYKYL